MEIIQVDPKTLEPHPKNPRSGHAVEKIQNSIKEFGFTSPILVQKGTRRIIAGHGRWKAALRGGGSGTVPVIELDLTDKKAVAYMIADNRLAEESGWEKSLLKELVLDLHGNGFDLGLTGFDTSEVLKFLPDQDEGDISEPPKNPTTKRGDIFQLGRHRLMCGDSLIRDDVSKLMAGEKASLVFTDPPYGVSYSDKNTFLNEADKGNRIQTPIESDNLNEKDIQEFWKTSFEIIRDNLAEENSYYIFGPQIQGMMMMMMMAAGLPYRHVIIWVKNNHVLGRCDYNYKHEPIFFGWTTRHKFYGNGEFLTSVWPVDKPHKSDLHPTMKPTRLAKNAILNSSDEDQIVLDVFGGSGSTLIAAEETNRRCFIMELAPAYCDVVIARWENFTGKKAEKINA